MNNQTPPENQSGQKPNGNSPMNNNNRNVQRFWPLALLIGIFLLLLFLANNNSRFGTPPISLNQLASDIEEGRVDAITVRGGADVIVRYTDDTTSTYYKDPQSNLFDQLVVFGVSQSDLQKVTFAEQRGDETAGLLLNIILSVGPFLIIVWLLWRMMRSVRGGQDQAMNFGRSRARVARDVERPQVRFTDVAGAEEAKEELQEIVEFLKEPDKFIQLGARIPKGVLMVGPPGTGKTLMARAVAGEAGVPFFHISGSEFVEMFVGVGASRVRDLFESAKKEAPAIIFIDEIDAVGRQRGAGWGGGHDEREQTLNQILVEMDGFENDTNIIMMAATNRPDILDPALLRPGRFDRKVTMDAPDVKGRLEILKVHSRGKPIAKDVELEAIAKITPGMSGADLENLINEAALLAARRNKRTIGMSEMQEAMERVAIGPERKSRVMSERDKRTTAYHEAGHALLFHFLENADPVHKITIVPRGRAGGYVMPLPEEDILYITKEQFADRICAAMGGRAAEQLVFNQYTTGASMDLQQATNMARAMVTQYGMSDTLGPRTFGGSSGNPFLGRGWVDDRDYSEEAAQNIDKEIQSIVSKGYDRAVELLRANREKLDQLVVVLMEEETLDRDMFMKVMEHGYLPSLPLTNAQNANKSVSDDSNRSIPPTATPSDGESTNQLGTAPA